MAPFIEATQAEKARALPPFSSAASLRARLMTCARRPWPFLQMHSQAARSTHITDIISQGMVSKRGAGPEWPLWRTAPWKPRENSARRQLWLPDTERSRCGSVLAANRVTLFCDLRRKCCKDIVHEFPRVCARCGKRGNTGWPLVRSLMINVLWMSPRVGTAQVQVFLLRERKKRQMLPWILVQDEWLFF